MANSAFIEVWQHLRKDTPMDGRCISQNELARRWQVSESTLERWRSQRTGPMFLRLGGQVRYRITDDEDFETRALGMATGQISDKMANELRFRKLIMPKNARQVRGS
jgi:transposase-like protein